jgi:hypothetical protein
MSKETKNRFILESTNVLKVFENKELTEETLKQISLDLDKHLKSFLTDNELFASDFPIKFENELGSWEMFSDGRVNFQPKTSVEYIELNITILPTGVNFEE